MAPPEVPADSTLTERLDTAVRSALSERAASLDVPTANSIVSRSVRALRSERARAQAKLDDQMDAKDELDREWDARHPTMSDPDFTSQVFGSAKLEGQRDARDKVLRAAGLLKESAQKARPPFFYDRISNPRIRSIAKAFEPAILAIGFVGVLVIVITAPVGPMLGALAISAPSFAAAFGCMAATLACGLGGQRLANALLSRTSSKSLVTERATQEIADLNNVLRGEWAIDKSDSMGPRLSVYNRAGDKILEAQRTGYLDGAKEELALQQAIFADVVSAKQQTEQQWLTAIDRATALIDVTPILDENTSDPLHVAAASAVHANLQVENSTNYVDALNVSIAARVKAVQEIAVGAPFRRDLEEFLAYAQADFGRDINDPEVRAEIEEAVLSYRTDAAIESAEYVFGRPFEETVQEMPWQEPIDSLAAGISPVGPAHGNFAFSG